MQRILVPTDFSPHADAALSHAVRFARAFGAEVHLLNVQVPYGPTSPLIDEFPDEAEARRELMMLPTGDVEDVRSVRRGITVGPTVIEYAEDHDVDLIVMGSHGRRGVPRLLLGSVAEDVLRATTRPVLVVHAEAAGDPDSLTYDRILVPVDFSPMTDQQLRVARILARRFSARLELVHSIDPPTMPDFYMPAGTLVLDMKNVTETVDERLEALADTLRDEIEVTTHILVGRAVREIAERAAHADLLVMPTQGLSGLDRALLGSVAEGVLRRTDCPVFAFKPNAVIDRGSVETV